MSVGQMIKLCRKEKGLTQSELAELIGVSMQAVSKWETDAGMPDISQIVPLARVLGVSSDKLLGIVESDEDADLVNFARMPDTITYLSERMKRHGYIIWLFLIFRLIR